MLWWVKFSTINWQTSLLSLDAANQKHLNFQCGGKPAAPWLNKREHDRTREKRKNPPTGSSPDGQRPQRDAWPPERTRCETRGQTNYKLTKLTQTRGNPNSQRESRKSNQQRLKSTGRRYLARNENRKCVTKMVGPPANPLRKPVFLRPFPFEASLLSAGSTQHLCDQLTQLLWSINSCENRAYTDQFHITVSLAQVHKSWGDVFFKSSPLTGYGIQVIASSQNSERHF